MKNLKGYEKLVFFMNSVAALILLLSYLLPYLPPKDFAFLSVLSLAVPLLIILNLAQGLNSTRRLQCESALLTSRISLQINPKNNLKFDQTKSAQEMKRLRPIN